MKHVIIFMLLIFPASISYAEISVGDFFSKDEIVFAENGGVVTLVRLKYNDLIITNEKLKNQAEVVKNKYSEPWFDSSEMISIEKGFIPYRNDAVSKLRFYNALLSFSSLTGMKYYSHKARSVEPFILKAYRINSPENKSPIENISAKSIDSEKTNYFLMSDNKFGELVFKSELYSDNNNFILKNICVHPVKKFGIKINESGEYVTVTYFLYDNKLKGYFYYTLSALRIRSDFFLKINAVSPKGFGNRLRAVTVHLVKNLGINWDGKIKAFD